MNRKTALQFILVIVGFTLFTSCNHADYQALMQDKLQSFAGKDIKKYKWISYPTNNFGIGTSFFLIKQGDLPTDDRQICATYSCLSITENAQSPPTHEVLLKANGFADIGHGPSLLLNEAEQVKILTALNLPKLIQKLDLGAEFKIGHDINLTIDIGKAYKRNLNMDKFLSYLKQLPSDARMRVAFMDKKLSIVVSDFVIDGFSMTVSASGGAVANLDAKLSSAVGSVIDAGSGIALTVGKTGDGVYILKSPEPLIIARLNSKYPIFGNDDSIIEDLKKPVTAKKRNLEWKNESNGSVPMGAFIGGNEPNWELYVCRVNRGTNQFPGKLISSWGCYVADKGVETVNYNYEVLIANDSNLHWSQAPSGVAPANALVAGKEGATPVHICRAEHLGGLHLGRTGWTTNHACLISYGGNIFSKQVFEVLTVS